MKYIYIIIFAITAMFAGCSTGVYSVSSGKADVATISFADDMAYEIRVGIDNRYYDIRTVKEIGWRKNRQIKQTSINSINIDPGKHTISVTRGDELLIITSIFISAGEHKIIKL